MNIYVTYRFILLPQTVLSHSNFVRWRNRTLCLTQSFSLIFILNVGTSLLNQRPQALTEWSQNPQTLSPSAKELSTHSSLALQSTIKKYM